MAKDAVVFADVVTRAIHIMEAYSLAADADEGFDGGEFSGPAADKAMEHELEELAVASGFTLGEVMAEIQVRANALMAEDLEAGM